MSRLIQRPLSGPGERCLLRHWVRAPSRETCETTEAGAAIQRMAADCGEERPAVNRPKIGEFTDDPDARWTATVALMTTARERPQRDEGDPRMGVRARSIQMKDWTMAPPPLAVIGRGQRIKADRGG